MLLVDCNNWRINYAGMQDLRRCSCVGRHDAAGLVGPVEQPAVGAAAVSLGEPRIDLRHVRLVSATLRELSTSGSFGQGEASS